MRMLKLPLILKLLFNAIVAWTAGLIFIAATLYFTNGGVDFSVPDIMGFGVMAVVVSGLLMVLLYLPTLYWLKRRSAMDYSRLRFALLTGMICNAPIFLVLALLINRKMGLSEAVGFMLTFLIIGVSFGLGFTFVSRK